MTDTTNYKPHQVLRIKDIENLLFVSQSTAKRYMTDIKETLKIEIVLYKHFCDYFKV